MSFLYNAFKNAPAIGKKIKSTITGMKPTTGKTVTNEYKFNLMKNIGKINSIYNKFIYKLNESNKK